MRHDRDTRYIGKTEGLGRPLAALDAEAGGDADLGEIGTGQGRVEITVGDEDLRRRLQRGADALSRALQLQRSASSGSSQSALAATKRSRWTEPSPAFWSG